LAETPTPNSVPYGRLRLVLQTVENVMSSEVLKKMHFQKDSTKGDHYRIRYSMRLTKSEKSWLMVRLAKTYSCSKVTVEDAKWTKAWLNSAKGVAIRIFP